METYDTEIKLCCKYDESIVDGILELQKKVFFELSKSGNGIFILEKTKEDYRKILENKKGVILYATKDDRIIASVITKDTKHEAHNVCDLNSLKTKLECSNCVVDPEYRKHRILGTFLTRIKKYYEQKKPF